MAFNKGDIVFAYLPLPNQKEIKSHPVLILSNEELYTEQEMYIGVMLTHMNETDCYTFEVNKSMFVSDFKDDSFMQIRLQLITYIPHKDCSKRYNSLKQIWVDKIIKEIKEIF